MNISQTMEDSKTKKTTNIDILTQASKISRLSFESTSTVMETQIYDLPDLANINKKVITKLLTVSVICFIFLCVEVKNKFKKYLLGCWRYLCILTSYSF